MTRLFILQLSLVALCLAADSNMYVNRIKIQTFHNNKGLDKTFTYYVTDSFDQTQVDNFKTEATSIASLYEDDYAPGAGTCSPDECPKAQRIYLYTNTTGGKITSRIVDDALIASLGLTGAKPMGYVSPFPGYCSSDDRRPIIEMYSDHLKQYAYWSPAEPNQLTNVNSATVDLSRYAPVRFVGYGLVHDGERLVLQNTSPDYLKPTGKKNYTHSFFPAYELVQFETADKQNIRQFATAKEVEVASGKYGYVGSTGVFLVGKGTSNQYVALDKICGARIAVWAGQPTGEQYVRLFPKGMKSGTPIALSGFVFQENRTVCGGIKGLAKVREFVHKTQKGRYTYLNDQTKIDALLAGGQYEDTGVAFGYAPLDQTGLILIKSAM